MFSIAKKCFSIALALCLVLTGVICVNAEEQAAKTYYLLDAEALQWNYNNSPLWRAERMNDGYVGVWSEMELVPGANYGIAVTVTAPTDATILPTGTGNSVTVYRKNAVSAVPNTDGVRISVFHNNTKIYPTDGTWATVSDDPANPTTFALPAVEMKQGDQLRYIVDNGGAGNNAYDSVYLKAEGRYQEGTSIDVDDVSFSQGLAYTDEASGNASAGVGSYTKSDLVSFESVAVRESATKAPVQANTAIIKLDKNPLSWTTIGGAYFWCGAQTANDTDLRYDRNANGDFLIPGNTSSVAVAFTAPCDGTIDNSFGLGSFYRIFNGTEPTDGTTDGARLTVVKNSTVIFPQTGHWADAPQEGTSEFTPTEITFNTMDVKKGDVIYYIVDNGGNGNNAYDAIKMLDWGFLWVDEANPDGVWVSIGDNFYDTATANDASSIAGYAKKEIISYLYTTVEELTPVGAATELNAKAITPIASDLFVPMTWNAESGEKGEFRIAGDNYIIVSEDIAQPSDKYMLAVKWTAEEAGRVDISKSYIQNWLFNSNDNTSDGVRYKVLLNNEKQILLDTEGSAWMTTKQTDKAYLDVAPFAVEKGDEILVIVDCNNVVNYDTMTVQMLIDFAVDGEEHTKRYNNIKSIYDTESAFSYYGIKIKTPQVGGNISGSTTVNGPSPKTGDNSLFAVYAILLVVCGMTITAIVYEKKGQLTS